MSPVRVTIVDDSRIAPCAGQCAGFATVKEAVQFAAEHLKRRFGPQVEVEYRDLAKEEGQWAATPLPAVVIGGVARLAGSVEYREIAEAVEAYQEVQGGRFL